MGTLLPQIDPWAWRSNMDAPAQPSPLAQLKPGPAPTGSDRVFDALYGWLGGTPDQRSKASALAGLFDVGTMGMATGAYDGAQEMARTGRPGPMAMAVLPGMKPVSAAAKAAANATPVVARGYRGSITNTEKYRDPQFGTGPWASSSPEVANTYAQTDWDGAVSNVTPMEFRFSNPFVHDAKGADWNNIPGTDPRLFVGDGRLDATDNIADRAQKLGHDGMIMKNVRDTGDAQSGNYGPPSDVIRPLQRGTTYSPLTKELLYSSAAPAMIVGSALIEDDGLIEILRKYGLVPADAPIGGMPQPN